MRRLLEGAWERFEEHNARSHEKALAKLTPAEREHYELWEQRTADVSAVLAAGGSPDQLGNPRLTAKVLQGPAGEAVHGITAFPQVAQPIEEQGAWERQAAAERAVRDAARVPYLAPARVRDVAPERAPSGAPDRTPVTITRIAAREADALDALAGHLAASGLAARPELVYGLWRVPDSTGPDGKLAKAFDAAAEVYELVTLDPTNDSAFVPPRYCWPPTSS